jgi:hypothetical protein
MSRVEQYKEYREVGKRLNGRMMESCLDDGALSESAELLGIVGGEKTAGDDVLVFEGEEDMDVLYEFALHEYRQNEKTAVELFRERELWESEMEKEFLDTVIRSSTSLFRVTSVDRSESLLVLEDLLNDEAGIEMIDLGFSGTADSGALMFCRRVPFEEFSMTSGVAFPFPGDLENHLLTVYERVSDRVVSRPEAVTRFVSFYKLHGKYGIQVRYE